MDISSNMGLPAQMLAGQRAAYASASAVRPTLGTPAVTSPSVKDSQAPAAAPTTKIEPDSKALQVIIDALQRRVSALAPELEFSVDKSSGQTIIKFMDPTTNTVIQQFPSEAILQIGKELDLFQKGMLLNRKA